MGDVTKAEALKAREEAYRADPRAGFEVQSHFMRVFGDVLDECYRQNVKWTKDPFGSQHHNAITWANILSEESGETGTEANDAAFGALYTDPKSPANQEKLAAMRYEAIQTAAVAFQIVRAIDNNDNALLAREFTQA